MKLQESSSWTDARLVIAATGLYALSGAGSLLIDPGPTAMVLRALAGLSVVFSLVRLIVLAAPLGPSATSATPVRQRAVPAVGLVLFLAVLVALRVRPDLPEGARLVLGLCAVLLFALVMLGLNRVADEGQQRSAS